MEKEFRDFIDYVSAPPQHREYGIGSTEGGKYVYRCKKEVLPAILNHLRTSPKKNEAIQAARALHTAYEHPEIGSESDFKEQTWKVFDEALNIAGEAVLNILFQMVRQSTNNWFEWDRAVRILIEHEFKEVAESAVPGVMTRYMTRRFVDQISQKEFDAAIEAIHVFGWEERERSVEAFLAEEDEQLKRTVISALGKHGDQADLPALKRRLGGLFKKPEKDDFTRSLLKSAIDDIKERSH